MKTITCLVFVILAVLQSPSQLLQVDQRADLYGNGSYSVTANAPIGQTFTPTNNAVGYVQLFVWQGSPAKLHVNLRSNSITGPLLATSRSITIPALSQSPIFFEFGTNIPVTAEKLYCLEPILEAGGDILFVFYHYSYSRGQGIVAGQPSTGVLSDMWFREGIVGDFPRFTSVSTSSNRFDATIAGLAGQPLVIESSTNGFTWLRLQTNSFESNSMSFSRSNALLPREFYRALYRVP